MPLPSRTRCAALILCCGAIAPLAAEAEGLGDLNVRSHLGDYFHAEIPVVGGQFPSGEKCIRLVADSSEADSGLPALRNAVVTVNAARNLLTITSNTPVSEPALRVSVVVGCGTALTRHYTVLLSPPVSVSLRDRGADTGARARREPLYQATPPEPVAAPAPLSANPRHLQAGESVTELSRRRYPGRPGKQKRFLRRMMELNPDLLSPETLDIAPPAGVTLKYPIPPQPTPTPVGKPAARGREAAKFRLVISAPAEETDYRKLPPQTLSAEIGDRLGDVDKDIGEMRRELDSLRAQYPNPPAAMRTLFVEMESRLARVELNATRVRLAVIAQQQAPEPPPAPPPQAPAEATPPIVAPAVVAPPPATPLVKETVQAGHSGTWIGLSFLLLFSAVLGVLLARRAAKRRSEGKDLDDLAPDKDDDEPVPAPTPIPAPAVAAAALNVAARGPETAPPLDLEFLITDRLSPVSEARYLAEMFRSYGRQQLAIETLKEFIGANPDKSLLPSIDLLRIHREQGDRASFEKLSRELAHEFNVQAVDWGTDIREVLAGPPAGHTLESVASELIGLPHVFHRIKETWKTQEGLDYLKDLLLDSRQGARTGFSLPVIQEISALIEMLELELAPVGARSSVPSAS